MLFWGIFGALVLRAVFIFAGVALIEQFEWVLFVFGAFLLFTAVRIAPPRRDEEVHPENNLALKLVRRVVPSTNEYDGQKMFRGATGKLLATPLFAVLILIETTDVVFAVDSIPAILAVSREQFIVFSSNAFAILGLRALYFLLADLRERFFLTCSLRRSLIVGFKQYCDWRKYHQNHRPSSGGAARWLTISVAAATRCTCRLERSCSMERTEALKPPYALRVPSLCAAAFHAMHRNGPQIVQRQTNATAGWPCRYSWVSARPVMSRRPSRIQP